MEKEKIEHVEKVRRQFKAAICTAGITTAVLFIANILVRITAKDYEAVFVVEILTAAALTSWIGIWIVSVCWEHSCPDAVQMREEERRRLDTEYDVKARQIKIYEAENPIVETYVISTQREPAPERKFTLICIAIVLFGKINRAVVNTTTFLCIRKDGARETKKVIDETDEYNKYIQLLNLTNTKAAAPQIEKQAEKTEEKIAEKKDEKIETKKIVSEEWGTPAQETAVIENEEAPAIIKCPVCGSVKVELLPKKNKGNNALTSWTPAFEADEYRCKKCGHKF